MIRTAGVLVRGVAAAFALLGATPAHAADLTSCVRDAEAGKALRRQHQLLSARDRFLACAAPDCPSVIRGDCSRWLDELTC